MDHTFRSAALGGFNRQDVLTYLEKISREAAEQQQQVLQQLEEIRDENARQRDQLTEQQEQLGALENENQELRVSLEKVQAELRSSQNQNMQLAARAAGAEQELTRVRAEADGLRPDAEAYRTVKDRTAGVELEAHRRAETIQAQAKEQAQELHRQVEQWMAQVTREYESLRTQIESTVSQAAAQLEQAGRHMGEACARLGEQDVALKTLAQEYTETDASRVAAPMPLEE